MSGKSAPTLSISMLPAGDGDCIYVDADGFRILIDGGRPGTGTRVLPAFLKALPPRDGCPTIDLAILTHVDSDHIGGLLALLRKPENVSVGEIWFNGKIHHQIAAGLQRPPASALSRLDGEQDVVLGLREALDFDRLLAGRATKWNAAFNGDPVMVCDGRAFPTYSITPQVRLVVLGPPQSKLEGFGRFWDAYAQDFGKASGSVLARRYGEPPTIANLRAMSTQRDVADTAAPNGASIVLVLEVGQKRVLFAADAHPDDLEDGVRRYFRGHPGVFAAIKVAHHGSARNTTSKLVKQLVSPIWLFSTSGAYHGHPDQEAVARILLANSRPKKLIFNYRSKNSEVWKDPVLRAHFGYDVQYGDGRSPLVVLP